MRIYYENKVLQISQFVLRNNNTHIIITYSFLLCISIVLLYDIDIVVCHMLWKEKLIVIKFK